MCFVKFLLNSFFHSSGGGGGSNITPPYPLTLLFASMACNPENERVDFKDGWFGYKSSFISKDEMKACEQTRTKFEQKKKNIVEIFDVGKILKYLK